MTPPQLNSTWAAAYIQLIVLLMIFLLGVPPIIKSLDLPEYLRRMRSGSQRVISSILFIACLALGAIALSFAWWIHPCSESIGLSEDWIGAILITSALVLVIVIWLFFFIRFRDLRYEVIRQREKRALRNNVLDETALDDLIYIGERSLPGVEKNQVLEALGRMINKIQVQPIYKRSYEQLGEIVNGILSILISEDNKGNINNFHVARGIFKNALDIIRNGAGLPKPDVESIFRVLGFLGKTAIGMASETEGQGFNITIIDTATEYASSPSSDISYPIEAIGRIAEEALLRERFFIARYALYKLKVICIHTADSQYNKAAAQFIGIASNIWKRAPEAREDIRACIIAEAERRRVGIEEYISQALAENIDSFRYSVAGQIMRMKNEFHFVQG